MERSFGADFSDVRVHEGGHVSGLRATAYTRGSDVHFAPGKFQPGTEAGDKLIGHELAHVTQQRAGRVSAPQGKGSPVVADKALEAEADHHGDLAASGRRVPVSTLSGTSGHASGGVQLKGETEGQAPDPGDDILTAGEKALDGGGTGIDWVPQPYGVRLDFKDPAVKELLRYLIVKWLQVSNMPSLHISPKQDWPPEWVPLLREKALSVRTKEQDPNGYSPYTIHASSQADQRRARIANKLCDAAAKKTPGEQFRAQFVKNLDQRIGAPIMSKDDIKAQRAKPGQESFTTCIKFAGDVWASMAGKGELPEGTTLPVFKGTNAYQETNQMGYYLENQATSKEKRVPTIPLPPGSWHKAEPGTTDRPKTGDFIVFSYAETETAQGGAVVQPGWFSHVAIMRTVQPAAGPGQHETWITVDGGGETAATSARDYDPQTNETWDNAKKHRRVKGWIDIAAFFEASQGAPAPPRG
jgi:hypothetical protein